VELDESSQAGRSVIVWTRARPPFPSCLAGYSSIPREPGRATQRIERAVSLQSVINDLVTGVWENRPRVQDPAVCSQVLGLLKIRSPWAGLPTNLALRSAGDTALATALTTSEWMVAVLSILDMAVSSNLPQPLAEASAPAHALLHDIAFPVSANHRNSQTPRSSVRKDGQRGAEGERCGDDANRRQFQAALLENCSFFADLVLRQVRGEDDPSRDLGRDSSREKWNVVRVSPTPPGSKAKVVLGSRPEEPAPAETPSFLLPTLWVEVGCRQVRILVSEKERP
jgi:hypothetical protein